MWSNNDGMDPNWRPYFSDSVSKELESLRSENEKLRKVAEASEDYLLNHESSETCFSCDGDMTHYDKVELALKEWKGE